MTHTFALSDEFLAKLVSEIPVHINGLLYRADLECQTFVVGDVVLDRGDGRHAVICSVNGTRFDLRDGGVIECGVDVSRLVKLELRS